VARHDAVIDGLTNLYNHRHFQESLSRLIRQSAIANQTFSILMMDLDNFKEANDTYGHLAGDAVLRSVGQTLLEITRKDDVAARYGGEEFAVLLNGLDSNQARMVAERIRSLVEKKPVYDDSISEPVRMTVSIGIATFPKHSRNHRELLNIADLALYRAKQQRADVGSRPGQWSSRVCALGVPQQGNASASWVRRGPRLKVAGIREALSGTLSPIRWPIRGKAWDLRGGRC